MEPRVVVLPTWPPRRPVRETAPGPRTRIPWSRTPSPATVRGRGRGAPDAVNVGSPPVAGAHGGSLGTVGLGVPPVGPGAGGGRQSLRTRRLTPMLGTDGTGPTGPVGPVLGELRTLMIRRGWPSWLACWAPSLQVRLPSKRHTCNLLKLHRHRSLQSLLGPTRTRTSPRSGPSRRLPGAPGFGRVRRGGGSGGGGGGVCG